MSFQSPDKAILITAKLKSMTLIQTPAPGSFNIFRCGDVLQIKLSVEDQSLRPHIRTSLGGAKKLGNTIIIKTEQELSTSGNNWLDLPFNKLNDKDYEITLPLYEVGYFEAKVWFKQGRKKDIIWAPGDNIHIKIEPASTIVNNSIYGIFTRQFGPNKHKKFALKDESDIIKELDAKGYHVIPPSGTFRDVIKELDHIMDDMGFRILQLLPIHPTPTTYARMGRFGSPYAALDFFSVDPALAEFDKQATPLDQFEELVDAVHRRQGEIFLDIPVDHTGWASNLQKDHPEYFVRDKEGHFISPGAWGTTWEDLVKLDFSNPKVRQMMAEVFLFWCKKGVDGFRCDAGYMVPVEDWEYIVAKIRNEFPDTIFLLEGLGGPPEVTEQLLSKTTFSWAYSELFQNYSKDEVTHYVNNMLRINYTKGGMVNFSETHDNMRLAAKSKTWSQMRNLLCALTAPAGSFGISNGVEYFAEEKISVHHASGLNWGNDNNQIALFKRLTSLFKVHPAFFADAEIEIVYQNTADVVMFKRKAKNGDEVLIAINLNCESDQTINYTPFIKGKPILTDLISSKNIDYQTNLKAGSAHCIDNSGLYTERISNCNEEENNTLQLQQCKALLLRIKAHFNGFSALPSHYLTHKLELLLRDPLKFCLNEGATLGQIVQYDVLRDPERMVMATSRGILLLQSKEAFNYNLKYNGTNLNSGTAIRRNKYNYFVLIPLPKSKSKKVEHLDLNIKAKKGNDCLKKSGKIVLLPKGECKTFKQQFSYKETKAKQLYGFAANQSGTMVQVSGIWGEYNSKYDSFFAANLDEQVPVDRTALLSRLRCWVVHNEFSHQLGPKSQYSFSADGASDMIWSFKAPIGQGKFILLDIQLHLDETENIASITFTRQQDKQQEDLLESNTAVSLIIRPDVEYRSNHEITKAFTGAENLFPQSIKKRENGFSFNPFNTIPLHLSINKGHYISEPEWHYMQTLPVEENRGLEHHTDLFSPGYFKLNLSENEIASLNVEAGIEIKNTITQLTPVAPEGDQESVLKNSIQRFIVKRNEAQTVIAGYPWFLDWGRDTLICLRGIIAAGMQQEAKDILLTFAKYEKDGTLPNMIRGNNASNRDTSDAPLWFIIAVKDYVELFKEPSVLAMNCGKRTVKDVIISIVNNYTKGTSNGIRMDKDSGLIYSPSHFTWMDTNYPAGTPREGYPIEIQSFWQAGVSFLSTIDKNKKWDSLAKKIKHSILSYYPLSGGNGFSDCLHTQGFKPAKDAVKDNACRPNQLFAVTLGVISEQEWVQSIVMATQSLIIPGAIRSLKDAPVDPPLSIYREGHLLNNPAEPYWGRYEGDEDTRRKPAYHNGTGWAWPFFSYCEALFMLTKDKENSMAILMSAKEEMEKGIINHMPEVSDGNAPHQQRGCLAQAWSITEYYRVLKIIK